MTQQEINDQVQGELKEYENSIYPYSLPNFLMTVFKSAIMHVLLHEAQLKAVQVAEILTKNANELTVIEVGKVTNVIAACKWKYMYHDAKDAARKHQEIEAVVDEFNNAMQGKIKVLAEKRARLSKLVAGSGLVSV